MPRASRGQVTADLASVSQMSLIVLQLTVRDVTFAGALVAFLASQGIPPTRLLPLANCVRRGGPLVKLEDGRRAIGVAALYPIRDDWASAIRSANRGRPLCDVARRLPAPAGLPPLGRPHPSVRIERRFLRRTNVFEKNFNALTEPGPIAAGDTAIQVKARIHRKLLKVMDLNEARRISLDQLHDQCAQRVNALLLEEKVPLSGPERQQIVREVMDEVFGYGPLDEFLRDPLVSDILVNGPHKVYIERQGRLEMTGATFLDSDHLMRVIRRIADNVGRRIDESTPMLDARLPDGSRVNAIIPPLALDGPALSIRRFGTNPLDMHGLIELDALREEMATFVEACVQCKLNILISGGTGTRQDHLSERSVQVDSGGRARRHDRRCRRAAASARARGSPGDAAPEHRGPGRDHPARPAAQQPAHAARPHHHRRGPRPAKRSTCSRP